jgi:hypothetical protein
VACHQSALKKQVTVAVKSNLLRFILSASLVVLSRGQVDEIQENREAWKGGAPSISTGGVVTFKLYAPNASAVSVGGDWGGERVSMTKDEKGNWTATRVGQAVDPTVAGWMAECDAFRNILA